MALPETVFSRIGNASHATAVPVAMMHYQYNRYREDAVSRNLVQVVDDQIREIPGAPSPYETRQLFAVAPKELYFADGTVSLVFKSDLWYRNVDKAIQKREINFNNESGYLLANWDVPVSYTFRSSGIKTIYFRLTYTDGTSYTSRTNIAVSVPLDPKYSGWVVLQDDVELPATDRHSGGKLQVALSEYNTSGKIKNPLIVAEGFDPYGDIDRALGMDINGFIGSGWPDDDSYGTINCLYNSAPEWSTFGEKLNYSQYDIVYLDYNKSLDDIWRNAQLLKDAIKWVNAQKESNESNVVLGISMGGLVARIALRQLENEGYQHETRTYISMDSPHKGANVPLGIQAAVRHMENIELKVVFTKVFGLDDIEMVKFAIDLVNSPAAKQMLVYTIDKNYRFDNSVHNAFQQAYDQLGFPQQCENIAVSNGSNNGSLTFAAGSPILDFQYTYSFKWWMEIVSVYASSFALFTNYPQVAWNFIPGKSQIKAEVNIDALDNRVASCLYKGKVYIHKKIFLLIPVDIVLENRTVNSTADMLPLDGAPGGLYTLAMLDLEDIPPILTDALTQDKFCFVPTVSALALSDWQTKLTQNLTNTVATPFDAFYAQGNSQPHTQFTGSAPFLCQYMEACACGPKTLHLENRTERYTKTYQSNGQIIAGENYTIENGANVTFRASKGIRLVPGVRVEAGANFKLSIEPCSGGADTDN